MIVSGEGFFVRFAKLDKLYRRACHEAVGNSQLTDNEIIVLMFLTGNAPLDTASDIAKYRGISKSLVAKSVDSLCSRNYLRMEQDKKDRRIMHLKLTEQSSDLVTRLNAWREAFSRQLLKDIPQDLLSAVEQVTVLMEKNYEQMLKGCENL